MIHMSPLAEPLATLEIGERRLPARMVAGRLLANLPRRAALPAMPPRRRLAALLLALAVPLVSASRHRHA